MSRPRLANDLCAPRIPRWPLFFTNCDRPPSPHHIPLRRPPNVPPRRGAPSHRTSPRRSPLSQHRCTPAPTTFPASAAPATPTSNAHYTGSIRPATTLYLPDEQLPHPHRRAAMGIGGIGWCSGGRSRRFASSLRGARAQQGRQWLPSALLPILLGIPCEEGQRQVASLLPLLQVAAVAHASRGGRGRCWSWHRCLRSWSLCRGSRLAARCRISSCSPHGGHTRGNR